MTSSDTALSVHALHVSYGVIPALRGVSIAVAKGGVTTVVGPNGAGKTTLLRSISGLEPCVSGEIRLSGEPVTGQKPWHLARKGIAHVPQGRRCFGGLTVEENLRIGAYRLPAARAAEQIDLVYGAFPVLREKRDQPSSQLSGGQQQMVAVGRALMSAPEVLLLDEPALGLSPLLVQELAKMLAQVAERFRLAILLAEQNTRLALRSASYAYVLRGGEIVLEGPSAEVAPQMQAAYFGHHGLAQPPAPSPAAANASTERGS